MCELLEILEVIHPIKDNKKYKYMDFCILSCNILIALSLGSTSLRFICRGPTAVSETLLPRITETEIFMCLLFCGQKEAKSIHFQNGTTCLLTTGLGLDWLAI